ncbi:MAG: tRNA preQ1(34) S-adenosylmethionine ribosyltransferase-isomerase QueA [Bacilli bacterium]|jgi:S-adenosylmethionine:tRNA ribosyltransferase-isomerase
MDVELFNYHLPEELIAQYPSDKRDHSRLLVVNKRTGELEDKHFFDIVSYLKKGDVIVRNNTRVIPARLFGRKKETNAKVEVLILRNLEGDVYECLVGNAKVVKKDTEIIFSDELKARCLRVEDEGIRILEFVYEGVFLEVLDRVGLVPLPPYIKDEQKKHARYQTVYAKVNGSAAAPTAGFHFTPQIFEKLDKIGVKVVDITLHVGLGTFRPISVSDTKDHVMHSEYYEISEEAADSLNKAKEEGRRIIAVGTTSVRTLEANYQKHHKFVAEHSKTNLFITPGYKFLAVDALITNFHLPKSTLLMLVSAFSSRELMLKAYEHAIKERYRFFSFGDAMFIYG